MHISRVDLNLFVVFDTLYTEGGVTAAAEKLHLSQPAVSHALGRLRTLFDDPLFERHGRAMAPTPLARTLIGQVRAALRGIESTLHETARFDPAESERHFAVAFRDVLEFTLVPQLMAAACRAGPNIELVAGRVERRNLESDLFTGLFDAAVDVLLPVSPAIRHQRLLDEPLVVVARKNHPAIRGKLTLKTYLALEHIQVSSRRRGPGLEDFELSRVGESRRIRLRCQHYGTASRTVSLSDLIATMPERYARQTSATYGNQILPVPFKSARLELYLYWHANAERDPAGLWLRGLIADAVRDS